MYANQQCFQEMKLQMLPQSHQIFFSENYRRQLQYTRACTTLSGKPWKPSISYYKLVGINLWKTEFMNSAKNAILWFSSGSTLTKHQGHNKNNSKSFRKTMNHIRLSPWYYHGAHEQRESHKSFTSTNSFAQAWLTIFLVWKWYHILDIWWLYKIYLKVNN